MSSENPTESSAASENANGKEIEDDDLTQYDEAMDSENVNCESLVPAESESAIEFSHFDSVVVNDTRIDTESGTHAKEYGQRIFDPDSNEVLEGNNTPEVISEVAGGSPPLDTEEMSNIEDVDEDHEVEEDSEDAPTRLNQLPISKVRKIMKIGLGEDTGVKIITKEAAFLVGQATELFVAALAQETSKITIASKKKTMNMQHLSATITESEIFSFLEGTMVPDYDF